MREINFSNDRRGKVGAGDSKPEEKRSNEVVDPGPSFRRQMVRGAIALAAKILLRLKFEGVENIPAQDGLIITTNHLSLVDTGILLLNPVRDDLAALVTDKYQNYPLIRFIITTMPHVWIDRSRADFSAFRAAIQYLKQGGSLGVAPEGTRSRTGQLMEGKSGAVLLAVRAGVPIVPVGIAGTDKFNQHLARLRRTPVTVRYGKAFRLPPIDQEERSTYMQRTTDEIMCRIAATLPEEYHGFYKNHPRLQELLDEQS